jgi:CRISPR-associated protein Csx10
VKYFSLELTTLSPVAIRADHAPAGVASTPYITGTTLAGSLAAAYHSYYSEQKRDFERLFLSGQVQFPNLYPATLKDKTARKRLEQMQENGLTLSPAYPLPKTAMSCKRFPGFSSSPREIGEEPGHGVRDSLLDWAVFVRGDRTHAALARLNAEDHKQCPACGKAINHLSGFYRRLGRNEFGEPMIKTGVDTRLQTHTGIDRATGTVREGILYSREVFEENSHFQGVVKLPDDDELARSFTNFVRRMGNTGLIRIGTGRTRGMGKVKLDIKPLEEKQFSKGLFTERLASFNATVQKVLGDEADPAPFYFALTLHAPTILRDPLLRYRGSINAEALAELLGITQGKDDNEKPYPLEGIYQTASVQRITGWNDLWGTPRLQEIAIESGSVFLFKFTGAREGLYDALFRLEQEGIGERTAEGFGRVCISDPFHREERLR